MLRSIRSSGSMLGRVARKQIVMQRRTFIATSVRQADFVQELYLREIKAYKPPQIKASDSEGHVQKFSVPKAPASPEEGNMANDLKAYEDQQVEVEGQAAPGQASAVEEDWFEDEEEDAAPAAH